VPSSSHGVRAARCEPLLVIIQKNVCHAIIDQRQAIMAWPPLQLVQALTTRVSQKEYLKLSNDEEKTPSSVKENPLTASKLLSFASTIILTALISSTITASILSMPLGLSSNSKNNKTSNRVNATCGTTVSEALENNCIFDMMVSRWEAPECHDAELLAEVLRTGPWQWYADANHTILVSREEVAKGLFDIDPLYTDNNYHVDHCMYMWMKQHRAYLRGAPLEEDLWGFKHTLHCAALMRKNMDLEFGRTWAGFAICRTVDVWEKYELDDVK